MGIQQSYSLGGQPYNAIYASKKPLQPVVNKPCGDSFGSPRDASMMVDEEMKPKAVKPQSFWEQYGLAIGLGTAGMVGLGVTLALNWKHIKGVNFKPKHVDPPPVKPTVVEHPLKPVVPEIKVKEEKIELRSDTAYKPNKRELTAFVPEKIFTSHTYTDNDLPSDVYLYTRSYNVDYQFTHYDDVVKKTPSITSTDGIREIDEFIKNGTPFDKNTSLKMGIKKLADGRTALNFWCRAGRVDPDRRTIYNAITVIRKSTDGSLSQVEKDLITVLTSQSKERLKDSRGFLHHSFDNVDLKLDKSNRDQPKIKIDFNKFLAEIQHELTQVAPESKNTAVLDLIAKHDFTQNPELYFHNQ